MQSVPVLPHNRMRCAWNMTNQLHPQLELLKAVNFAADRHRHQRRKDHESSPFINHPIAVAETLAREGGVTDLPALQAALLHDTIEDTETSAEELEQIFGPEVRDLVLEVTDDKTLPKQERKQNQITHALHISDRAKQIKMADKICNVSDILHAPPADWPLDRKLEYLTWSEAVVEGCRGVNAGLERRFDQVLEMARQAFISQT
jgi:guanosine-3',5'-bis(diphosphate) 3'-pyrophosphohydrolase